MFSDREIKQAADRQIQNIENLEARWSCTWFMLMWTELREMFSLMGEGKEMTNRKWVCLPLRIRHS
jgi:hypothetical protein